MSSLTSSIPRLTLLKKVNKAVEEVVPFGKYASQRATWHDKFIVLTGRKKRFWTSTWDLSGQTFHWMSTLEVYKQGSLCAFYFNLHGLSAGVIRVEVKWESNKFNGAVWREQIDQIPSLVITLLYPAFGNTLLVSYWSVEPSLINT